MVFHRLESIEERLWDSNRNSLTQGFSQKICVLLYSILANYIINDF
jgi:hypothetical protein